MKAFINSILIILFLTSTLSCERKAQRRVEDLSNKVSFRQVDIDKNNALTIIVKSIFIYETDKRRNGLVINPDNIEVAVEISIKNNSLKEIIIPTSFSKDINSTRFYGCFNEGKDCFKLIDLSLPDSLTIRAGNFLDISLGSMYYDFESLFGRKDDYTKDMIGLIDDLQFKYYICDDNDSLIIFTTDKNTEFFKQNTY
jgi:hypothetical protein